MRVLLRKKKWSMNGEGPHLQLFSNEEWRGEVQNAVQKFPRGLWIAELQCKNFREDCELQSCIAKVFAKIVNCTVAVQKFSQRLWIAELQCKRFREDCELQSCSAKVFARTVNCRVAVQKFSQKLWIAELQCKSFRKDCELQSYRIELVVFEVSRII